MVCLARLLFFAALITMPMVAEGQEKPDIGEEEFKLQWPIDCTVFEDCFIKHYPDLRAGTNRVAPMDYQCGQRTKPGFEGTNIVFKDHSTTSNKLVSAMAPGRVMFRRNDVSDTRRYAENSRRACGNYVQIRHSSTHSSKYCHLREGSIEVDVGNVVKTGAQLGQVGASGATENPKLAIYIFENGNPVDPFTGRNLTHPSECFATSDKQMWAEDIPYPDAGIMAASFASGVPPTHELAFEAKKTETLPAEASAISAWVRVFGVKKGDKEKIVIKNPNGEVWHQSQRLHPVSANFWTAVTTAEPSNGLESGVWKGEYTLKRQGETVADYAFEVKVP